MKLEGSVALVTGANRGLGKAIVAALAAEGEAHRRPCGGEEEIFPDPQSQQMGILWNKNHKEYERAFASF
jgi:NAD(P)-dependent dehydrogenase (short-subunit alcohol dehydrogenase family)